MNPSLFTELPVSPPRGVTWRRHPERMYFAHYEMLRDGQPTGAWVRHCCHPTAHRPYYVVTPDNMVLARKFTHLTGAKLAAVMVIENRYDEDAWIEEAFRTGAA